MRDSSFGGFIRQAIGFAIAFAVPDHRLLPHSAGLHRPRRVRSVHRDRIRAGARVPRALPEPDGHEHPQAPHPRVRNRPSRRVHRALAAPQHRSPLVRHRRLRARAGRRRDRAAGKTRAHRRLAVPVGGAREDRRNRGRPGRPPRQPADGRTARVQASRHRRRAPRAIPRARIGQGGTHRVSVVAGVLRRFRRLAAAPHFQARVRRVRRRRRAGAVLAVHAARSRSRSASNPARASRSCIDRNASANAAASSA